LPTVSNCIERRKDDHRGTRLGAVFPGIMLNGLTIERFPYLIQDLARW
jgi:hypothetical protein